jgi:hypothetical protein
MKWINVEEELPEEELCVYVLVDEEEISIVFSVDETGSSRSGLGNLGKSSIVRLLLIGPTYRPLTWNPDRSCCCMKPQSVNCGCFFRPRPRLKGAAE